MIAATGSFVERYHEQGYAILRDSIPREAIEAVRDRARALVDDLARELAASGAGVDLHADLPLERRLAALVPGGGGRAAPLTQRMTDHPEPFALVRHPALLDAVEPLIGPELTFHGDYHFRLKFPHERAAEIPWHQDSQYYGAPTRAMRVVTAWIPLVDTDAENGCLWVIPGSHRWGLLPGARAADNWMVTPEDVAARGEPLPVPMRVGDVLLFSNLTFHASFVNRSERMRLSLDCRYHPTRGTSPLGEEEAAGYDMLYGKWRAQGVVPVAVRSPGGVPVPEFAAWQAQRAAAAAR